MMHPAPVIARGGPGIAHVGLACVQLEPGAGNSDFAEPRADSWFSDVGPLKSRLRR
jgi:hypothetical protein